MSRSDRGQMRQVLNAIFFQIICTSLMSSHDDGIFFNFDFFKD